MDFDWTGFNNYLSHLGWVKILDLFLIFEELFHASHLLHHHVPLLY